MIKSKKLETVKTSFMASLRNSINIAPPLCTYSVIMQIISTVDIRYTRN